MMRRCLVVAALWSLTSIALAQEAGSKEEASAHFRQGVELFREGAYRAALVELQRAYEIAPDYRVLFNIGQTQLQLGEYVEAIRAFEKYLVQGGAQVDAKRREEVETELANLRKRVATLAINVSAPNAAVFVDTVEVGKSPLPATVPVSVGRHRVFAQGENGENASVVIDVAGGDLKEVDLELKAVKIEVAPVALQPAAPAPVPQRRGLSRRDRWGVGLLSGSVAVGIGAGVTGFLASDAHDDYTKKLKLPGSDVNAARDDMKRYALISDVLTGSALALAATGLVLLLTDESPSEANEGKVSVRVGLAPNGVFAGGRF